MSLKEVPCNLVMMTSDSCRSAEGDLRNILNVQNDYYFFSVSDTGGSEEKF